MPAPVVVFAVGNRSRGDDALGPLLLERLAAWLDAGRRADRFELIDDFQLQIEHALDLSGRRLALFIDAGVATPAPWTLVPVPRGGAPATHSTHALPPEAVLAVYREITRREPPPSFVLCVRGERFELGEEPSAAALTHLEAAWHLLLRLVTHPDAAAWSQAAAARGTQAAREPARAAQHAS
jgi:hydrogenase maturation protease